jgi:glycerol uptake facilitator-like aquaporin
VVERLIARWRLDAWRHVLVGRLRFAVLAVIWLSALFPVVLKPARDLAPRLFSPLAGWGTISFEANGHGSLMVYILPLLLGGVLGGGFYRVFFRHAYRN